MNKNTVTLGAIVVATMLLSAMVLAAPALSISNIQMPQIFNIALAIGAVNEVTLDAEVLPNGQYAYSMVSHTVDGEPVEIDYAAIATIPGPTIIINEGEALDITVTGSIPGIDSNVVVDNFDFNSAETGTYVYKGEEGSLLGLFGAIIVNDSDGSVESYVDGGTGDITPLSAAELEREFVLFMVGSTFWGMEIASDGTQTPLWTNPMLHADHLDKVRFHVLSIGHGHTFHLHAHRWADSGTSSIIDTKLMETPSDTHVFTVEAGADVGPGSWQYHCHVFAHMEAGMHGMFHVGSTPDAEHNPADSVPGASPYNGLLSGGEGPGLVTFEITDEPGSWFKSARGDFLVENVGTVTKSLELARPGDYVNFVMTSTATSHSVTSLLWPTGAENMPMHEVTSYKGGGIVELTDPGLYVFTCVVHPYMFGGVIVDDPETQIELDVEGEIVPSDLLPSLLGNIVNEDGDLLLDLGETVTLINGYQIPTGSDLALRLTKTFFVATTPENWRDYTESTWNPSYPGVSVKASVYLGNLDGGHLDNTNNFAPVAVANLDTLLDVYFAEGSANELMNPADSDVFGVGEVWVDTQFEKTDGKSKPGTATALDTTIWEVSKKVALELNNPHNMWTDKDQTVIYQTEWFDNKLTTFDRESGEWISTVEVGESPSHVMTRTDTDDIHVALNGEEGVAEILATTEPEDVERIIAMQGLGQAPTHPHAHWMSSDGQKMVTPNAFTHDTTLYGFDEEEIIAQTPTGTLPGARLPIATGMKPDDSYYVVANLLSSSLTVLDVDDGSLEAEINLLGDYNPAVLVGINDDGGLLDELFDISIGPLATYPHVAALPIQTPISPDGKYMVTANTLTGNIVITDVSSSAPDDWEVVESMACDPGCHGVQFGAKAGGGYLAYVSSKFANDLVVIDVDEDSPTHLEIVGRILLNAEETTDGTGQEIEQDDFTGTGGQGLLAIPNVYNGWVQNLPNEWSEQLTCEQRSPVDLDAIAECEAAEGNE